MSKNRTPRDFYAEDRTGAVRLARTFSNIVSPPTIFAAMGIAVAFHTLPFESALFWGVLFGLLMSLLPILGVLLLMRIGWIEELHMSNTSERWIPYLISISMGFLMFYLVRSYELPTLFQCVTIFVLCDLIALFLITTFWLISMHTTAAGAAAGLIWIIWGRLLGLTFGIPLLLVVLWNRLFLKRHTPAQAWSGAALGLGSAVVLFLSGCF